MGVGCSGAGLAVVVGSAFAVGAMDVAVLAAAVSGFFAAFSAAGAGFASAAAFAASFSALAALRTFATCCLRRLAACTSVWRWNHGPTMRSRAGDASSGS